MRSRNTNPRMPLPAPHERVTVTAARYTWGVYVAYVGCPRELLAAGALDMDAVLCLDAGPRRAARYIDANGDAFRRLKRPTKTEPDRVEIIRHIYEEATALELPGVRAYLDSAAADESLEEMAIRDPLRTRQLLGLAIKIVSLVGVRGEVLKFKNRDRIVGRRGRQVMWAANEKLIVVDWERMVGERLAAQGGA